MIDVRTQFAHLHTAEGVFAIPNPWDIGSAKILEALGFKALATTSSGFAGALGVHDQETTLDQLVDHVADLTAAVAIPINVDAEFCFADSPSGIVETIERLATAGAAGISIEDFDPRTEAIIDINTATNRVAAATAAARRHDILLTARAENHIYGIDDIDDTTARLEAFRDAGADVVYAPGVIRPEDLRRVVDVGLPVNALALPGAPSIAEMGELGVRRVSTGGALVWAAYGALARAGRELLDAGTYGYFNEALSVADRSAFDS
ncbi:MAG: isocitrate lyase/phosphoenolpyruvate mutase family protein [Actinomycetia bacterium]|nr:isocitrate lyase/phosphoenolpyruvate mutase family protein [Actinomycetes bacterium]MCP4961834.1 isocitrate lyase/phosphoenolpyruvate mutase family protein [Actinomycetes bacterium]